MCTMWCNFKVQNLINLDTHLAHKIIIKIKSSKHVISQHFLTLLCKLSLLAPPTPSDCPRQQPIGFSSVIAELPRSRIRDVWDLSVCILLFLFVCCLSLSRQVGPVSVARVNRWCSAVDGAVVFYTVASWARFRWARLSYDVRWLRCSKCIFNLKFLVCNGVLGT